MHPHYSADVSLTLAYHGYLNESSLQCSY